MLDETNIAVNDKFETMKILFPNKSDDEIEQALRLLT